MVLTHTAETAKIITFPGFFWLDLILEDVQYLMDWTSVLSVCTDMQVEVTLHCSSETLAFQISTSALIAYSFLDIRPVIYLKLYYWASASTSQIHRSRMMKMKRQPNFLQTR